MKFQGTLLAQAERERIHAESLRILAEVGVKVTSAKVLKLLEGGGARIDWDANIARIPAAMVENALDTVPKTLILGGRNPQYDFAMPSVYSGYALDGTGAFAIDFASGERRYGTRKDIENGARVFQQMDLGVMAWPPTCASDAPENSRVLHEFITTLRHSSKHVEHELHRPEEVPFLIEALKAILGSADAIRQRKICSVTYCPVAPLVHEGPMCEAYLELAQYDVPIMALPMPATGSTGPANVFYSVCQANAEALSSIVIFQLARPGAPILFGSASGSIDFHSGAFLEGSPEMVLQTAAMGEMGRFYNLPNTCAGCITDAKETGAEAILEKMITTLPLVMIGVDIVEGVGEIESSQTLVLEQIVVDNELAHLCKRLYEGVFENPTLNFYNDIAQAGPGGNFLASRNTLKAMKSPEFYLPKLIDHSPYETWLEIGKPDMYAKAREIVQNILTAPPVDPLPEDAALKLDEILLAADKELAEH
jgi:trimethylamine--corrinoid protein Co-methyltransferase